MMLASSSTTLWYTTRATGVVALVLLTLTLVLGILTAGRAKTRSWPAFAQADLHKRVSLLAMVFLAFHVLTAVLDTYVNVGWTSIVVPFASPYRPVWTGLGTVGVDLILAVAVSSALRHRIRARTWRSIHWLAYGSWPVALAHSLGEGTDGLKLWMDVLAAVCTVAVVGSLAWRIRDHRSSNERAIEVGALTRAVPDRAVPDRAPRVSGLATATAPRKAPADRPRRVDSATRILEKERR
jgi:sulfoxide reductase heme-binding subunit YedZ